LPRQLFGPGRLYASPVFVIARFLFQPGFCPWRRFWAMARCKSSSV
jgi:hypothetical protein